MEQLITLAEGAAIGIASGATFLGGAKYMIRAELSKFETTFMERLNGTYVRGNECKLVQSLREEQFKNIDERLDSEGV